VTVRIFPKTARHSDPRLANDQFADLAAYRVSIFIDHVCCHSREWPGECTRLDRREYVPLHDSPGDLPAPGIIDDGKVSSPDILEEPHPWIGIPWFAAGMEFPQ